MNKKHTPNCNIVYRKTPASLLMFLLLINLSATCSVFSQFKTSSGRLTTHNEVEIWFGQLSSLEGGVREKLPAGIDGSIPGITLPENFNYGDLGLDDSTPSYGGSVEFAWKYITLNLSVNQASPSASTTVNRGILLSVDGIEAAGEDAEYLFIDSGTRIQSEADMTFVDLRTLVTPITLSFNEQLRFIPWLEFGVQGIQVDLNINAGNQQEVREIGDRRIAFGGTASGDAAGFIPRIGFGGNVQWDINSDLRLDVQATWSFLEGTVDEGVLGSNSDDEAELDLSYTQFVLEGTLEYFLSDTLSLFGGIRLANQDAEGTLDYDNNDTLNDLLTSSSLRLDKEADLTTSSWWLVGGIRF